MDAVGLLLLSRGLDSETWTWSPSPLTPCNLDGPLVSVRKSLDGEQGGGHGGQARPYHPAVLCAGGCGLTLWVSPAERRGQTHGERSERMKKSLPAFYETLPGMYLPRPG